MLKGDLSAAPLTEVLRQLADGAATGCLSITHPTLGKADVFLRNGRVYASNVPGRRPGLGSRLVSSGALAPEALNEALEAQRIELQGWRLGELLVHLGYVDQPVVEAFVEEQIRASLTELLHWNAGAWRFRVNQKTRDDVAPPVDVESLLAEVEQRQATMRSIAEVVHGPMAVPVLSASGGGSSEMEIDADAWSLLCKIDGSRTVEELAADCGFTLFEVGQVLFALVQAGLVDVEEDLSGPESAPFAPVVSPDEPLAAAARLASALSGLGPSEPAGRVEPIRSLDEAPGQVVELSVAAD